MAESGEQLAKSLQNKDLNNKKRKNENLDVEEESIIEEDGDLIKEEEEKNWKCLMKGVVLLPQFLTIDEQVKKKIILFFFCKDFELINDSLITIIKINKRNNFMKLQLLLVYLKKIINVKTKRQKICTW